jgi:predicted RNase H-like nuclease (RuvC/YqgF family)
MGMPARKLEFEEVTVEARLARLEEKVENIQSDVTELKGDIRRLDDKIDRLNTKVDGVKDSAAGLTVTIQKMVTRLILWGVACFAALLATMARGFHWL